MVAFLRLRNIEWLRKKESTQDEIIFWENRYYQNDKIVLNNQVLQCETYNVSWLGWNKDMEKMLLSL